jgi:hypothetical protein
MQKLHINIIGVNTLNVAFERIVPVKYKHNHVMLLATDDEVEELKRELMITGLAFNVGPYESSDDMDSKVLQPGNIDGNGNKNFLQNLILMV